MTEEYKADICYECTGYGDDYYIDENGDLVSACSECWIKKYDTEDDNVHNQYDQ